jgi:hypothetical protein
VKKTLVRHCVEESNVDETGIVLDPKKARHVTIRSGRIEAFSGPIDAATHLNLDYPEHGITRCVIAEKFEKGARVRFGRDGLDFAAVDQAALVHLGPVDFTQRYFEMVDAVRGYHGASREAVPT